MTSFGQAPVANFTVSEDTGCSPMVVTFTNTSTNATSYSWTFGDGTNSPQVTPSKTYTSPGSYTVTLTATNATGSNTKTVTAAVVVLDSPIVNFSANITSGCPPLTVDFTDQSNPVVPGPATYNWNFGTGTPSTLQNPQHTFDNPGDYMITLSVTNSGGCNTSLQKPQYIHVHTPPDADFNVNTICRVQDVANFTTSIIGTGPYIYEWDYGDGTSWVGNNPSHAYSSPGNYSVKLIVTDANGCKDTVIKPLNVGMLNASFTHSVPVCKDVTISFTNSSVAGFSYLWDFGDGNTSTLTSPTNIYTTAGVYSTTLIATDISGLCKDTMTIPLNVNPGPTAAFDIFPVVPCAPPDTVFFTNQSTNGVSYWWGFGDDSTSTSTSPYHIYNKDTCYYITLVAMDALGCTDTVSRWDSLYYMYADFGVAGLYDHCVPSTIPFSNGVVYYEYIYPLSLFQGPKFQANIASFTFDFGDGSPPVSNVSNPSHTYTAAGTYTVTYTAVTDQGCVLSTNKMVTVDTLPTTAFSITGNDTLCLSDTIYITDLSTGTQSTVFHFLPPNDSIPEAVVYPNQTFPYMFPTAGIYTSVVAWGFNGACHSVDTLIRTFVVKGPEARVLFEIDCDTPTLVRFMDSSHSAPVTSRLWTFGDGTTDTAKNPVHIYSALGSYNVTLTVHSDSTGCTNTKYYTVTLQVPSASFSVADTAICQKDTVKFTPNFSNNVIHYSFEINPDNSNGVNYVDLDPLSTRLDSIAFIEAGLYTVTMHYQDVNGCWHDTTKTNYILVADPDPDILSTPALGCAPLLASLTENGTNTPGAYAVNRAWTFGDGTSGATSSSTATHTYSPGVYNVKVVVTDNVGCVDSITKPNLIEARQTTAKFKASDTTLCIGQSTSFSNQSSSVTGASVSYTWNFGDGSPNVTGPTPTHTYNQTGLFTVTLIATDNAGCADTLIKPNYIDVAKPDASFTLNDSVALCPPLIVQFTNTSTGAVGYTWALGDGTSSVLPNPSNIYTNPGKYTITLVATNSYGCKDTFAKTVDVLGYAGILSYSPTLGCNPFTVSFSANLTNVTNFMWDFSDGIIQPATGNTVTHTYTSPGKYLPKIVFTDSAGCINSSDGLDTVFVDEMKTDFTVSPTCVNTPIQLKDSSYSYFSRVNSWSWNVNNGQYVGNSSAMTVSFSSTGTYPVVLITKNANGCIDTVIENITIHPLPVIDAGLDTIICVGDAATLTARGGISYNWSPATSLGCATCASTSASPIAATNYIVLGTDANGCVNKDSVLVKTTTITTSTVGQGGEICADDSIQLNAYGAQRYEWKPATNLDNAFIANPTASPDATTLYTVFAYEGSCKPDSHSVRVVVHPLPTVNAGQDEIIVSGNTVNLNASGTNISKYSWTPSSSLSCGDCSSPVAKPTASTTYTVIVLSDFGCTAKDEVTINVLCDQSQLFIPNTFSPNGDGDNDVFYPRGEGLKGIRSFRIYNRWGQLVYERQNIMLNDVNAAWDGKHNGSVLNPDVFVYVVEGICDGGEIMIWKGDISLIR